MARTAASSKRKVVDLTGSDAEESTSGAPPSKAVKVARSKATVKGSQQENGPIHIIDDEEDDDYDGANELVAFSQSVDDHGVASVHVGTIDAKVVGIQYYDGYASMGESVLARREPTNQYDSNAIRIDNVQGSQIGHIPRKIAAKLASYMDDRSLLIEATLTAEKGTYGVPIQLKLYGNSEPEAKMKLEERMKHDKLPLKKEKRVLKVAQDMAETQRKKLGLKGAYQVGAGPSSQPDLPDVPGVTLEDLRNAAEAYRPRGIDEIAENWSAPEKMLEDLPLGTQPEHLSATMLPYQLQGLKWMQNLENPTLPEIGSDDIVQLWRRSKTKTNMFSNIATSFTTQKPPSLAKGGILADDMGLGKTIMSIGLIVSGSPGTTLIVAPVSVMSNWSQQIERHVKQERAMKVLTYHGSNRNKAITAAELGAYDVVITAYGTMATECTGAKTQGGIYCMNWKRVILDEGHTIRNPGTKVAVAACNLEAESRWILSGTPIVNTVKDLYSMLRFLRITGGLEKLDIFNSILTRPLSAGSPEAEKLLQSIMQNMVLRRKKDMKFIDLKLPPLSEYIHRIEFRNEEREKYEALQAEAKGQLQKYQDQSAKRTGKAVGEYQHLLEILLRLRQVCCHWKLCGEDRITKLLDVLDSETVLQMTDENKLALQALLALSVENVEECPICLEDLHRPVITACKHIFGLECIQRIIEGQHKCPMCRATLTDTDQLIHPRVENMKPESEDEELDTDTKSSKTEALMEILKASMKDPKSKIIVFSQWTSFLNIIQKQLIEAGLAFSRVDGSMKAPARDAAIRALDSESDTRIMLASLAVCSVGLNLVMADTVILADSWWSPAIEDQAVDRVHRLGQTRPTTVWRLIIEGSIEERVLDIQKEKRKLVGKAFREKGKGDQAKSTRLGDIQRLLK